MKIQALRVIEVSGEWGGRTFGGEPFPFVDRQVTIGDIDAGRAAGSYEIGNDPWTLRQSFVEVEAGGVTGRWGPIEHHEVAVLRDIVAPWVVGEELPPALAYDRLRRRNRHGRSGLLPTVCSQVELAIWDAAGRRAGVPVYELLGGAGRREVPCYLSMLGAPLADAADVARHWADRGWRAQKWFFRHGPATGRDGMLANVDLAERVRGVGEELELMFDAYCGWDRAYALECCRRLEDVRPRWVEEPLVPEDVDGLADLRRRVRVPIATGEHVYGRQQTAHLIAADAVDVLQNDPLWTGGLQETLAVMHLASAHSLPLVPHGHALLPALHVSAVAPPEAVPMLEVLAAFLPERHLFLRDAPMPEAGRVTLPDVPGLATDLDETRIDEQRVVFELTA